MGHYHIFFSLGNALHGTASHLIMQMLKPRVPIMPLTGEADGPVPRTAWILTCSSTNGRTDSGAQCSKRRGQVQPMVLKVEATFEKPKTQKPEWQSPALKGQMHQVRMRHAPDSSPAKLHAGTINVHQIPIS